jgi:DNA repair protein RecN (Recombination protein N)
MLQRLNVKNFAIIDHVEIEFDKGFQIITGETGAGKSIILGALDLLLGKRADLKALKTQGKKCVIEGHFEINSYHLESYFADNDLDYELHCILRREINPDGKSRAFINDTPVNLQQLKGLGEQLVDIHSQHESLEINSYLFQLGLIDSVADHKPVLTKYAELYKSYTVNQQTLAQLKLEYNDQQKELDYIQFQYNELEAAALKESEQEQLEQELQLLSHAEEIRLKLNEAGLIFDADELGIISNYKRAQIAIQGIEKLNPSISQLADRLRSLLIEIKDISGELESLQLQTQGDPARIEIIEERLDLIYRLQQKHRLSSVAELLSLQNQFSEKLQTVELNADRIVALEKRIAADRNMLIEQATLISKQRVAQFDTVKNYLIDQLQNLGIPNAQFEIAHHSLQEPGKHGMDEIQFRFSANKGQPTMELAKAASGGELGRLMLCIKSLLAKKSNLPTLILDEIDTGVSGEVAIKMGQMMQQLAQHLQVISITHLPQIAGLGNSHYFVYKNHQGTETTTQVKKLSAEERIVEIAKMLGGDSPSLGAFENAKELLKSN